MATATKKSSEPVDSGLPAPAPAPAAPPVQGCGTPNCTGAKGHAPAALTVTANVATGRTRAFTAVSPGGCLPKNLAWDFGDGTRAVGPSPMSHTFAGTGTSFNVVVAPQNSTRSKASAPLAVTIT